MATLLKASGATVVLTPGNGRSFTLAELQAAVGGYLEVVPTRRTDEAGATLFMVLNEDGKRLRLAVNLTATVLLRELGGGFVDIVVGDVVLATVAEMDEPDEEET